MKAAGGQVVIVGAGVAGVLVARDALRGGQDVVLVERGGYKPHADQLGDGIHTTGSPTARPNHEPDPAGAPYPWSYVYGVGGSTLHWAGAAPRFLPSDFELFTRFGVGVDWPLRYEDLERFYREAEEALAVAGAAQPAHPHSPGDELVRPALEPFRAFAQARPTRSVDGRPPCTGVGRCELCPVDARYSAVHTFERDVAGHPGLTLLTETIAARVRLRGGRALGVECIQADGSRLEVGAGNVVLAANGIENAALLLRSGLRQREAGRGLYDHGLRVLEIELDRLSGAGRGSSLATGVSHAYADGPWRSERASAVVAPHNPGISAAAAVVEAVVAGRRGPAVREPLRSRFEHTLVLDVSLEDLPRRDRHVTLSPRRDRYGLPLNRVAYPPDSEYVERSWRLIKDDLLRRLAPLGARLAREDGRAAGGHQIGTCPMGSSSGVVDPEMRHHDVPNLYVAGASAFPAYSAMGPTLTIAALAIRLGRQLGAGG